MAESLHARGFRPGMFRGDVVSAIYRFSVVRNLVAGWLPFEENELVTAADLFSVLHVIAAWGDEAYAFLPCIELWIDGDAQPDDFSHFFSPMSGGWGPKPKRDIWGRELSG